MTPRRLHARCTRCALVVPLAGTRYARHRLAGSRGWASALARCPGTDMAVDPAAVHAWLDGAAAQAREAAADAEREAQRATDAARAAAAERTAVLAWVGRARAKIGARVLTGEFSPETLPITTGEVRPEGRHPVTAPPLPVPHQCAAPPLRAGAHP